jgi:hypothetical protein
MIQQGTRRQGTREKGNEETRKRGNRDQRSAKRGSTFDTGALQLVLGEIPEEKRTEQIISF